AGRKTMGFCWSNFDAKGCRQGSIAGQDAWYTCFILEGARMQEQVNPAIWPSPPENPTLQPDEVHVWRAMLDRETPCVEKLLALLTPEEQARARRFHFQKHRDHFVVARGLLRLLLGRYL